MSLSKEIIALISKTSGHLSLAGLGLGDDEIVELAKILQGRSDITSLDLQANMFGSESAIAVLRLPHIATLDMSDNNLKDIVIKDFISFLRRGGNSKLVTLNLSRNCLTDESIKVLLQAKQDAGLAEKIAKITFYFASNEEISSWILDQFYGRSAVEEQQSIVAQFVDLNRTSELSPCYQVFSGSQRYHSSKERRHHSKDRSKGKAPASELAGEMGSQGTPALRDQDAALPVTQACFRGGQPRLPKLSLPARPEDKAAIKAVEEALNRAYPPEGADAESQEFRQSVLEELRGFRGKGLTFGERDQLSQRAQELRDLLASSQAEASTREHGSAPTVSMTGVAGAVSATQGGKVDVRVAEVMTNVEHQSVVNHFVSGCSDSRLSDERLAELKQRLNERYVCNAVVTHLFSVLPTDTNADTDRAREFKVEEIYINLLLIKERQAKEKERKLKQAEQVGDAAVRQLCYDQIRGEKESIDIERIFDSTGRGTEPNKRVVIFGCAGSGKTTLCKYIVKRWMDQKEQGSRLAPLWAEKFEWVFWIPLRNVVAGSYADLLDTIYYVCFGGEASGFSKKDIQRLWNQMDKSKVLLILDGFDEVAGYYCSTKDNSPLTQLLSDAFAGSIILTSRPYAVESSLSSFKHHLEVTGFTIENVSHYVENFFPGNPVLAKDLIAFLDSNPTLRNLAQIPINLELLCDIWESTPPSKDVQVQLAQFTVTEIYEKIVEYLMRRYLEKFSFEYKDRKADTKNLKKNRLEALLKLEIQFTESLAFKMEIGGKLILQGREIDEDEELCAILNEKNLFPMLSDLGFLKGAELGERTDGSDIAKEYYFLHLTLQEFFTARFIARWIKDHCAKAETVQATQASIPLVSINGRNYTIQEFIAEYKYNPRYEIVWPFVAGLLRKDCRRELNFFFDCLLGEPRDLVGLYSSILHIRCLEECLPQPSPSEFLVSIVNQLENLLIHWDDEFTLQEHPLYLDRFDLVLNQLRLSPKVTAQLQEVILQVITTFSLLLQEQNDHLRSSAVDVLIKLGVISPQEMLLVLRKIFPLLRVQDWEVNLSVARILRVLAMLASRLQARMIVGELLSLLKDQDMKTQPFMIEILGMLRKKIAQEQVGVIVSQLLSLPQDQDNVVRSSVVRALGKFVKLISCEERGIVEKLLPLLQDQDNVVRSSVVRVLGKFVKLVSCEERGIVEKLLPLLQDQDNVVRSSVVRVLGKFVKLVSCEERGIVEKLLPLLQDQDNVVRSSVVRVLGKFVKLISCEERGIVEKLLPLLQDQDNVERSLDFILRKFVRVVPQEQVGGIVEKLLPLLKESNVKFSTAFILIKFRKLMSQEQKGVVVRELLSSFTGDNPAIRFFTVFVLYRFGRLGLVSQEQVEVIIKEVLVLLGDKDKVERINAIYVFYELRNVVSHEQVGEVISGLLPLLSDHDNEVKSSVVRVFGKFVKVMSHEQAEEVISGLLPLLSDHDNEVKSSVVRVFGKFVKVMSCEQAGEVIKELLSLIENRYSIVEPYATKIFCKFVKVLPKEQAEVIIKELLPLFETQDKKTRTSGVDAHVVGKLLSSRDHDEEVKSSVIRVFGKFVNILSHEQAGVTIKELLSLIGSQDKEEERTAAIGALYELIKVVPKELVGEVIKKLLSLLADRDRDWDSVVQSYAARILRKLTGTVSSKQREIIVNGLLLSFKGASQRRYVEPFVVDVFVEVVKIVSQEQAEKIIKELLPLLKDQLNGRYCIAELSTVKALSEFGKIVPQEVREIIRAILPFLSNQISEVISFVIEVLCDLGEAVPQEAEGIIRELLPLIKSKDEFIRRSAVSALVVLAKIVPRERVGEVIREILPLLVQDEDVRSSVASILSDLLKQRPLDAKDILRMGVGAWGSAMTCLLWLENRALFFASDPQCSGGVMVCWIDSSNEIKKVAVPKEEVQNLRLGIETAMRDMLGIVPQELVTPRSTILGFFPAPTGALPPSPASILPPQRSGDQDLPESREAQETSSTLWCCIQ